MPKVAHCATPFLHTDGSWLYNQLRYLKRYEPLVLTQEARNRTEFPVPRLLTAEGYGPAKRLANRLWRKATGEYPFYGALLRREGADLMHAHFGDVACRCLRAQRQSGLPMLTSFYGYDATQTPRDPYWAGRYRRLFEVGAAFLVEGPAMKERLVEAGCPAAKIELHRLGVDVGRIAFVQRRPGPEVRFLICAAFREKKGIPDALQALGLAAAKGAFPFSVTVVGDGPLRPQIEATIVQSGLEGRVRLIGMQPYSRVVEILGQCDVLLQTSKTAADGDTEGGAPVILLDAQAAGMPVVATRHADIPEYVPDEKSGYLAPEGDVDAIAAAIRRVVEGADRWAAMGQAGRRHVEERYNAAVQCAQLERLYDRYRR